MTSALMAAFKPPFWYKKKLNIWKKKLIHFYCLFKVKIDYLTIGIIFDIISTSHLINLNRFLVSVKKYFILKLFILYL